MGANELTKICSVRMNSQLLNNRVSSGKSLRSHRSNSSTAAAALVRSGSTSRLTGGPADSTMASTAANCCCKMGRARRVAWSSLFRRSRFRDSESASSCKW